jgi:hypothetical protein
MLNLCTPYCLQAPTSEMAERINAVVIWWSNFERACSMIVEYPWLRDKVMVGSGSHPPGYPLFG